MTDDEVAAMSDDEVIAATCRGKLGPGVIGQALYDRVQSIIAAGGIAEIDPNETYRKGWVPGSTKGHAVSRVSRGSSKLPKPKKGH